MIRKDKGKRTRSASRTNNLTTVILIAYLIMLLIRIPLGNMTGDAGMAYFSPAGEIYLMISFIFSCAYSFAVESLIKYRIRREQYRSAGKVLRWSMEIAILSGGIISLALLLGYRFVADIIVLEPYSALAVVMMSLSAICLAVTSVLRGYFQGIGTRVPTIHSWLLERIIFVGFSFVLVSLFGGYGQKVANLLHLTQYRASYQVMGIAAALLLAGMITMIHMIVIYTLYNSKMKRQKINDSTRTMDSRLNTYRMLLVSGVPNGACILMLMCGNLIQQRIYYYYGNIRGAAAENAVNWGIYYGKYMTIIGGLCVLCCMIPGRQIKKIAKLIAREDIREARDQIRITFHKTLLMSAPLAVFAAVAGDLAGSIFWKGNQKLLSGLIPLGSILICLIPLAFLMGGILYYLRQPGRMLLYSAAALIIQTGVCSLFLAGTKMDVEAVVLSTIVYAVILLAAFCFEIFRQTKYVPEWLRGVVIPLGTAAVSGLLQLLLKTVLSSVIGGLFTLLICLAVGIIVYGILLIILRGVNEEELNQIPGGFLFIQVAKMIHFM